MAIQEPALALGTQTAKAITGVTVIVPETPEAIGKRLPGPCVQGAFRRPPGQLLGTAPSLISAPSLLSASLQRSRFPPPPSCLPAEVLVGERCTHRPKDFCPIAAGEGDPIPQASEVASKREGRIAGRYRRMPHTRRARDRIASPGFVRGSIDCSAVLSRNRRMSKTHSASCHWSP